MTTTIFKEWKEAFEELKKTEADKVYTAIENREFPPLVFNPIVVSKTINEVLLKHDLTCGEFLTLAAQRELTPEETQLVEELKKLENTNPEE